MESLTRRFGCHQCANRQLLTRKIFIADHMPPTKIVEQMNKKLWRRWLGIKVRPSLIQYTVWLHQYCSNSMFLNMDALGPTTLVCTMPEMLFNPGECCKNGQTCADLSLRCKGITFRPSAWDISMRKECFSSAIC